MKEESLLPPPLPSRIGDLLLTTLFTQRAAALPIRRELTPAVMYDLCQQSSAARVSSPVRTVYTAYPECYGNDRYIGYKLRVFV